MRHKATGKNISDMTWTIRHATLDCLKTNMDIAKIATGDIAVS